MAVSARLCLVSRRVEPTSGRSCLSSCCKFLLPPVLFPLCVSAFFFSFFCSSTFLLCIFFLGLRVDLPRLLAGAGSGLGIIADTDVSIVADSGVRIVVGSGSGACDITANNPSDRFIDPDATTATPSSQLSDEFDLRSNMDFGQSKPLVYATLRAANDAAIHLLALIRATAPARSYMSQCLVSTSSFIGYQLRLEPKKKLSSWKIGTGHQSPLSATSGTGVDFLLRAPGSIISSSRACRTIDGTHGLFYLHPESGLIMFRSWSTKPTYYHQKLRSQDNYRANA
jgi:hypothetical protein